MNNTRILKFSAVSLKCVIIGFLLLILFLYLLSLHTPGLRGREGMLHMGMFVIPPVCYLLGIVFGIIARKANKAKWAVSIGIFLLIPYLLVLFFILVYPSRRAAAIRHMCMNNVRSLVQTCHMYAAEYDGEFPDSFKTLAGADYYIINLTSCPTARGRADYGLNSAATMDCPPGTPLVGDFDSTNHNDRGGNIGYVDGRTRWHEGSYSAGSGPLEDVDPQDWVRQ